MAQGQGDLLVRAVRGAPAVWGVTAGCWSDDCGNGDCQCAQGGCRG
jgi:hypothetical protein